MASRLLRKDGIAAQLLSSLHEEAEGTTEAGGGRGRRSYTLAPSGGREEKPDHRAAAAASGKPETETQQRAKHRSQVSVDIVSTRKNGIIVISRI